MTDTKLIEEITKLARKHINAFSDAGSGMYNLDIDYQIQSKPETYDGVERDYLPDVIFQVYPYEDSEFYGLMYILARYYPTQYGADKNLAEHDDIKFEDLSDIEQKGIFSAIKKKLGYAETDTKKRDIDNLCIHFDLNTAFKAEDLIRCTQRREELSKFINEGATNDEILGKIRKLQDNFYPLIVGIRSVSFGEEKPEQKDEKLELVHKMKEFLFTKMGYDYNSKIMNELEEFICIEHEYYNPAITPKEKILVGICELDTPSLNKLLHDSELWDEETQIADATAEEIGKMVEFYHNKLCGNVRLTIEDCNDVYVVGSCHSEKNYEIKAYSGCDYIGIYTPIEELIDFVLNTRDKNNWYDTIMKALGKK